MTQPLDFSNQDLRNRSFKWRTDLANANFQKADIRGCDFSYLNLEGADFSDVTTGQSRKQIFIAIANVLVAAFLTALLFALLLAFVSAITFVFTFASVGMIAGIFTIGFTVKFADVFAFVMAVCAFVFPFVLVFAFATLFAEFYKANILKGKESLLAISLKVLRRIFLIELIEEIFNVTGTSFKGATLTKSKFTGAILRNCDFTDTKLHQADWTHAHFTRCKLSGNLDIKVVRELCISRIGINEDFSSCNLSELNLIGVNLRDAILSSANLNGTNLTQADLENTNLCNVKAIQTDFSKANLSGACIENWSITSETIFTDTICNYVFLDRGRKERKPASGFFEQGDFEKFVI